MLSLSKLIKQILCDISPTTDNNSVLWRMLWVLSRFKHNNRNRYTEIISIAVVETVKNHWISQL